MLRPAPLLDKVGCQHENEDPRGLDNQPWMRPDSAMLGTRSLCNHPYGGSLSLRIRPHHELTGYQTQGSNQPEETHLMVSFD